MLVQTDMTRKKDGFTYNNTITRTTANNLIELYLADAQFGGETIEFKEDGSGFTLVASVMGCTDITNFVNLDKNCKAWPLFLMFVQQHKKNRYVNGALPGSMTYVFSHLGVDITSLGYDVYSKIKAAFVHLLENADTILQDGKVIDFPTFEKLVEIQADSVVFK